jgi:DNA replication protein DnaC
LAFIPLIIVDEVGYIPLDLVAANLVFSLLSSRYDLESSPATSRSAAGARSSATPWAATATIDRLIHHAEIG